MFRFIMAPSLFFSLAVHAQDKAALLPARFPPGIQCEVHGPTVSKDTVCATRENQRPQKPGKLILSDLSIVGELKEKTLKKGRTYPFHISLKNVGQKPQTIQLMSCSWYWNFYVLSSYLRLQSVGGCDKNFPKNHTLEPGMTKDFGSGVALKVNHDAKSGPHTFNILLDQGQVYRSAPITVNISD